MAGLKWNTGKLYYSTVEVELGYQHIVKGGLPILEKKNFFCAQDLTWQHFRGLQKKREVFFLIGDI